MQISPVRYAGRMMVVATALAVLAFAGAMKPAHAQSQSSSGSVESEATENYIGSVRGGIFLFQNSHVHSLVGYAGSGGITITVEHKALVDRTSLDVDYIGASKGGNSVRLIPVLAEYTAYQSLKSGIHPYTAYGAGIVYSQITDTTNTALMGGKSGTEMAFSFALGADFKNNIYAEVRYLYTGSLDGEDTYFGTRAPGWTSPLAWGDTRVLLTDTHCHLNHERFKQDFEEVFERAKSADVRRLLVVGFDLDSSRYAFELSQTYPEIEAVIGIHPEDARSGSAAAYAELRALASAPAGRVVAWGEIGLDYYWQDVPQPIQRGCFEAQLGMAQDLSLPVVIHCRNAYTDVLDILAGYPKIKADLHCFTGSAEEAARAVNLGCYLGAGGILTFKKSQALRETFAGVPRDRILTETDSPYLAPQPHRGKRNEPAFVAYVIATLADIFQVTPAEIAYETSRNAEKFFGKPRPMARP